MNADPDESMDVRDPSGKMCGRYHFDSLPNSPKPFYKSYFNGLCTPKGCNIVAPQPPDHPHHKGLQYGLCATDVNFWEEDKDHEPKDHPLRIGIQFTKVVKWFDTGFSQETVGQDDVCVSFHETRNISVRPTTSGYVWTWQTTLTAQRDVDLIVSMWPNIDPGYYGLGLRLAPELFLKKSKVTRDLLERRTPKRHGSGQQGCGDVRAEHPNPAECPLYARLRTQQSAGFCFCQPWTDQRRTLHGQEGRQPQRQLPDHRGRRDLTARTQNLRRLRRDSANVVDDSVASAGSSSVGIMCLAAVRR
jgi:hypothetical protein